MKIKFVTPRGMTVEAIQPDEQMSNMASKALVERYNNEVTEFMQECAVALRKIKPGERVELSSRPIVVIIEGLKP